MPELPEVETTTRGMQEHLLGLTITGFWCGWDNMLRGANTKEFTKRLLGATFVGIERRGKNILAKLSTGDTLLMHMKMTGHFMYGDYLYSKKTNSWSPAAPGTALSDPYNRFIHVVFSLSSGKQLVFCDARKFGSIELLSPGGLEHHTRISSLGPEPLSTTFTKQVFRTRLLLKPNWTIKKALLDQTVLAGVGNIYADESLHRAGIHPETQVANISLTKQNALHAAIIVSLRSGLELGGDSTSDYRNIYGERGASQNTHHVYRMTGTNCTKRNCPGIITRIVVAGRGTHFCPLCQAA
jgi:formamidopyrimidine-DNA glycosylase